MDPNRSKFPHVEYEAFLASASSEPASEQNQTNAHSDWPNQTPLEIWQSWSQRKSTEANLKHAIATKKDESEIELFFEAHRANLIHTKVAILNANERFFFAQSVGDMHELNALWAHSEDVVCTTALVNMRNPEGATIIGGHQNIMNYYAKHTPTLHPYVLTHIQLMFYGNMAVVTCMAHYFSTHLTENNQREEVMAQYVTNVFCKEQDGDRYLLHSHTTTPCLLEDHDPRIQKMRTLRNTYRDPSYKPLKKPPPPTNEFSDLLSQVIGRGIGGGGNNGDSGSGVASGSSEDNVQNNDRSGSSTVDKSGSDDTIFVDELTGTTYGSSVNATGTPTSSTSNTINTTPRTVSVTPVSAPIPPTSTNHKHIPFTALQRRPAFIVPDTVDPEYGIDTEDGVYDPTVDGSSGHYTGHEDALSYSSSDGVRYDTNNLDRYDPHVDDDEPGSDEEQEYEGGIDGGIDSLDEYEDSENSQEFEYDDVYEDEAEDSSSDSREDVNSFIARRFATRGDSANPNHTTTPTTTPTSTPTISTTTTLYTLPINATILRNPNNNPIINNLTPGVLTEEQAFAVRTAVMHMTFDESIPSLPEDGVFYLPRPAPLPPLVVNVIAAEGRGMVSVYEGGSSGSADGSGDSSVDTQTTRFIAPTELPTIVTSSTKSTTPSTDNTHTISTTTSTNNTATTLP